jgi:hypothetical protein
VRVGGPTASGSHRVHVSSLDRLPLALQVKLAFSDDRGATWTINRIAAVNPSFIDRPWIPVSPSSVAASQDRVYIVYHDFTASQINGNVSTDGGTTFVGGIMHVGGICTNGIFCSVNSGNRDLADSISIAIDRGGSAALVWTDQGAALHGPTDITYGCVTSQQTAIVGANPGLSCKGPAS